MEAIILAGGLGTRLSSRLTDRPKAMAPVAGRPFLDILLEQLVSAGCKRITLSVGYLRQIILDAYQSSFHGVPIEYVIEETPLGTGGAILLALQHCREPNALVLNGDTFLDADFSAMLDLHQASDRSITMAVSHVENIARYGGVLIDQGTVSKFIEKGGQGPGWINAGAYVLSRDFPWPANLPSKFSFESDVMSPHLALLRPNAFLCEGFFLDIGIPEDLDRAQVQLSPKNRPAFH